MGAEYAERRQRGGVRWRAAVAERDRGVCRETVGRSTWRVRGDEGCDGGGHPRDLGVRVGRGGESPSGSRAGS